MNPLAPKPFTSGSPGFKGFQGRNVQEKSQTLPAGMPGLSGDILKQRIKTLHDKTSPNLPNIAQNKSSGTVPMLRSTGSLSKGSPPQSAPQFSSKEIINRRDSMHKAPPPPPPDSKKCTDKTPEFLRKKLKPTGKMLGEAELEQEKNNKKETQENKDGQPNFRDSRLLFQQISGPPIAPKPRSLSKLSTGIPNQPDKEPVEESEGFVKGHEDTESVGVSETASEDHSVTDSAELESTKDMQESSPDAIAGLHDTEANKGDAQEVWPKPQSIELPDVPEGLTEWMKRFVGCSKNLTQLDAEQENLPPPVLRELKVPTNLSRVSAEDDPSEDNGDIYDDVQTGNAEVVEKYDEADGSKQTGANHTEAGAQAGEDLYDDVNNTSPVVEDELYDDVKVEGHVEELYDDVEQNLQAGFPSNEGDNEVEGGEGEDLYEPVETIAAYVSSSSVTKDALGKSDSLLSNQSLSKGVKKKEEKDRKERERLEKKRREEAEKKFKKEEEERKRREKEERKRIEKERKLFNLKPDEDPVPIERHMSKCEVKGKGKDLAFSRGEYLDIISKNNCPKGKVLAQNSSGKLGYVQLKDLGIDKRKSLLEATSPVALGVAFGEDFYEEVSAESEHPILSLASSNNESSPVFQTKLSHFKQSAKPPAQKEEDNRPVVEGNPGEDVYELIS